MRSKAETGSRMKRRRGEMKEEEGGNEEEKLKKNLKMRFETFPFLSLKPCWFCVMWPETSCSLMLLIREQLKKTFQQRQQQKLSTDWFLEFRQNSGWDQEPGLKLMPSNLWQFPFVLVVMQFKAVIEEGKKMMICEWKKKTEVAKVLKQDLQKDQTFLKARVFSRSGSLT